MALMWNTRIFSYDETVLGLTVDGEALEDTTGYFAEGETYTIGVTLQDGYALSNVVTTSLGDTISDITEDSFVFTCDVGSSTDTITITTKAVETDTDDEGGGLLR